MEKLMVKYEVLIKCNNAFSRSLKLYQTPLPPIGDKLALEEALNASVIKHFELFYETFFKYLKFYLFEKHGLNITGSKTLLRGCYDLKIVEGNELTRLLEIVDIRNATTHMYDEAQSKRISAVITDHAGIIEKVVTRIKP